MCILYILYIYIHIYVYKSFSTTLDKGLRKNNNKKRDRETRKHKLNEMGALTMNRKSKTNWIKVIWCSFLYSCHLVRLAAGEPLSPGARGTSSGSVGLNCQTRNQETLTDSWAVQELIHTHGSALALHMCHERGARLQRGQKGDRAGMSVPTTDLPYAKMLRTSQRLQFSSPFRGSLQREGSFQRNKHKNAWGVF